MSLIEKIKALFNAEESVEVKFKDAKLKDGTTVRITEELAVGSKCEIINEDGTLTPAPVGEYTLEDGSVFAVDENGVITDVKTPEEEPAEDMGTDTTEVPAAKPAEVNYSEQITALTARVDELYKAVEMIVAAMQNNQGEMNAVKKENSELKKQNEELSKKAAPGGANFKKFEKTIHVKIDSAKPRNEMLQRIIDLKERNK